jgi:hypothetical protein
MVVCFQVNVLENSNSKSRMYDSGCKNLQSHYEFWPRPNIEIILLNLNSVNQLIFVMVQCGVLFEVRTEFLNNI